MTISTMKEMHWMTWQRRHKKCLVSTVFTAGRELHSPVTDTFDLHRTVHLTFIPITLHSF